MKTKKPVTSKQMSKLPYILTIDFDGCIVEDKYPIIGQPRTDVVNAIKQAQSDNPDWKWILWTCRDGKEREDAVECCAELGIKLDAVNDNLPEVIELFGNNTRKVYANKYIDDKNLMAYLGFPRCDDCVYRGMKHGD